MVNQNTQLKSQFRDTPIECVKAVIVQLRTSDGLSKAKGLHIGQTVNIVINSKRVSTITSMIDGKLVEHSKWIYNIISETGNPLGWICAEWCFPEMVIL